MCDSRNSRQMSHEIKPAFELKLLSEDVEVAELTRKD